MLHLGADVFTRLRTWEAVAKLAPMIQPLTAVALFVEAKTRAGTFLALSVVGWMVNLFLAFGAAFVLYAWVRRFILGRRNWSHQYVGTVLYMLGLCQGINAGVLADAPERSWVLVAVYLANMLLLWWLAFLTVEERACLRQQQ